MSDLVGTQIVGFHTHRLKCFIPIFFYFESPLSFQFKLSDLGFDHHAKDKFLRLVGHRYDKDTDTVTIITDRLVSLSFQA